MLYLILQVINPYFYFNVLNILIFIFIIILLHKFSIIINFKLNQIIILLKMIYLF